MSVFNPYKVRREKQKSRPFQLENDEDIDQLSISMHSCGKQSTE